MLTWTNETRKLSDLTPWPRNPRQIDDAQATRLAESWDEFGQVETLAIGPDDELYDGHQRLKVLAAQYGADYEVDVRVASRPLTEKEREKLTVMLVKAAGGWDWDLLADWDEGELLEWGFDEGELEFDKEKKQVKDPGAQIDKAAELQEVWKTELGQVWELGSHRLVCGDCTDEAVVREVMGSDKAILCHTDPPYGINASDMTMGAAQSALPKNARLSHGQAWDNKRPDILWMIDSAYWLCVWGGNYFADVLSPTNDWLCWHKKNDNRSFSEFELAWTNYGKQTRHIAHHWGGEQKGHITQKPLVVIEWAIEKCPDRDGIVFDPFLGSGTTLIACERLGRKCRAIEIEPKYVAVALQRWADATGKTPQLINAL